MNIVQIVGGEGSGKTTLAILLAQELTGVATVLTLDRYRRNKHPGDSADFVLQPESIDWPLVHAHMAALSRGERVLMPEYDLLRGLRLPAYVPQTGQLSLSPTEFLVVEGLHYLKGQNESFKVFVDAPVDIRRERVRQRDIELEQNLFSLFDSLLEPAYERYTSPLRVEADLVLNGTQPAGILLHQVQRRASAAWGSWG